MEKVYVTAEITVKTGWINEAEVILRELAKFALNECGCESYQIMQSLETQGKYSTLEVWMSKENERKHWDSKGLSEYVNKLKPMLEFPPVVNKYIEL